MLGAVVKVRSPQALVRNVEPVLCFVRWDVCQKWALGLVGSCEGATTWTLPNLCASEVGVRYKTRCLR